MGRILIVEDDREMRLLLAEVLEGEGFPVDMAVDAEEALYRVHERRSPYAAVVLDHDLPGVNGLEVLPDLRALSPGSALVLMTSVADPEIQSAAAARGAHAFLQKPVALNDLLRMLREGGGPIQRQRSARLEPGRSVRSG